MGRPDLLCSCHLRRTQPVFPMALCRCLLAGSLAPSENLVQVLPQKAPLCLLPSCGIGCRAVWGMPPALRTGGFPLLTRDAPSRWDKLSESAGCSAAGLFPALARSCRGCCWQRRELAATSGSSWCPSCVHLLWCCCLPCWQTGCLLAPHPDGGHCHPACWAVLLQEKARREAA